MSKIQEIREISHAKMESHARNVGKNGRIEMANAQPKDKHAGNAISQTILQPNAVLSQRSRVKSTQVRPLDVDNSDSDDSNYCYAVETRNTKHPTANVTISGQKVKFTIDTGSSIIVISSSVFEALQDVQLKRTNIKAFPFHSTTPVKVKGKFQTTIESRKMTVATIYVTADEGGMPSQLKYRSRVGTNQPSLADIASI